MFLNILDENEKENFLELAFLVANYNEDFANEQKHLINEYRREMLLTEEEYEIKEKDQNKILDSFININIQKRKSIYIEIISLILSDKKYDKAEKEISNIIKEKLKLSDEFYEESIQWVYDMQKLYSKANKLVFE